MTNGPQGPGWWQASDGNWYPPQPVRPPQQQQAGAQPNEGIAVTTHVAAIGLKLRKPKIFVDGSEIPGVGWGRTVVPTLPGQHQVHVYVSNFLWPRQMGPADTAVQVEPGRLAELEYKAPAWQWSPGSLGVGPQRYNGVGISVAFNLVLAAFWIVAFAHRPASAFFAIVFVVSAVVVLVKASSNPSAPQPPGQQAVVVANWYPDPNDPTLMRYFDGQNWTSQTAPRR